MKYYVFCAEKSKFCRSQEILQENKDMLVFNCFEYVISPFLVKFTVSEKSNNEAKRDYKIINH